jgi:hypothetical protein
MTSTGWKFSAHAAERLAKRLRLILDMRVEAEISRMLDSAQAKPVKLNYGRSLYQIPVMGVNVIAVCNTRERIVITFMDAERWNTKFKRRTKRDDKFRPKGGFDEEE